MPTSRGPKTPTPYGKKDKPITPGGGPYGTSTRVIPIPALGKKGK